MPICTMTEYRSESEFCQKCDYAETCKNDHPVAEQYEERLKEAAEVWREAKELMSAASAKLEHAENAFKSYVKETGECEFRIGNLSVRYKPEKRASFNTAKILQFVPKEKLDDCKSVTNPMVLRVTDLDKVRARL